MPLVHVCRHVRRQLEVKRIQHQALSPLSLGGGTGVGMMFQNTEAARPRRAPTWSLLADEPKQTADWSTLIIKKTENPWSLLATGTA